MWGGERAWIERLALAAPPYRLGLSCFTLASQEFQTLKGERNMRKKALQVLVAVSAFIFLMTSAMDTFAAKTAPSSQVKAVQTALNKDGYKVAVDGKMGKQTHDALMKFQKANGLPATGKADAATVKKLGVK
jgi:hypothetical protein